MLGLVLCSFMWLAHIIYVALFDTYFPNVSFDQPEVWFLLLQQIACGSYLLYRFLGKPNNQPSSRALLVWDGYGILTVSVYVIAASRWLTSTHYEMFGQVILPLFFFILATLVSLPVMLIRKTELQQRLMMRLPNGALALLAAGIMAGSIAVLVIVSMGPQPGTFIGGPR